jgi:metal-responsive CopG/Arc/MetJ family transcriptional regulator
MHTLDQLEKQQIGLRIPQYLIEEVDNFTKEFSVNRTDIIIEALKSYLDEQRSNLMYKSFESSVQEAKEMMNGSLPESTLGELIDELNHTPNA